tara:strand:+ start:442 stop:861 length:420 start_codon:yes stop_codon:yes gene_type:complete
MDLSDLDTAYEIEKRTNPSPWSKENFFSSFEVGHKSLVCKLDNIIIGFVIYSNFKKESHLLSIAVDKNLQRKGAGSLLLESMIRQSKALGAKKILLEVRMKNKGAIDFYKKFKFVEDAVRVGYYTGSNPDDALLMSLDI